MDQLLLVVMMLVAQADVQFAQLLLRHRSRSVREQALGALRLRERDHVADRIGAGHHGDDTIKTEGDTAMGRRAELQGVQQEAELLVQPLQA